MCLSSFPRCHGAAEIGNRTEITNLQSPIISSFHRNLASHPRVRGVINLCAAGDVFLRLRGFALARENRVSDGQVEGVGASARAEGGEQDAVTRLGDVKNRRQPDDGRSRIGVADHRDEQSRRDLFGSESEQLRGALRELGVGLVEDRPLVVRGGRAERFHQRLGRGGDVGEIGRFAREADAMLGVLLVLAPPEVGRVGDVGIRGVNEAQRVFGGSHDVGRAARCGGVLERVAWLALGGVHADGEGVIGHARADESYGGDNGFGARFAGEFPVARLDVRGRANRFGHDGGGGFDRIRVRLRPDPNGAQLGGINPRAGDGVLGRFDGHCDHVFVQPRDGFLFDRQASGFAACPHAGDFFGGQTISRHVRAVADEPDRSGGTKEGGGGGRGHISISFLVRILDGS